MVARVAKILPAPRGWRQMLGDLGQWHKTFDYRPFQVYILPMATLYEAARKAGIQFAEEMAPVERRFDTGELGLGYLDWGPEGAPPVILLHGFAQNAHSWDYTALALAQKYRVISLDARGHGDSDWADDADYSTAAHQRDLDRFIEQFGGVPYNMEIENKLAGMGLTVSEPNPSIGNFVPAVRVGNLVFVSGNLPRLEDGSMVARQTRPRRQPSRRATSVPASAP